MPFDSNVKIDVAREGVGEKNSVLVIPVFKGCKFGAEGKKLNKKFDDLLAHNADVDPNFDGGEGQTVSFALPKGSAHKKAILLGMGEGSALNAGKALSIGSSLQKALVASGFSDSTILAERGRGMKIDTAEFYARLTAPVYEGAYKFDKYKTADKKGKGKKKAKQKTGSSLTIATATNDAPKAEAAFAHANAASKAKMWAQDLGNEPANKLYPESYAKEIQEVLEPLGVKVHVINVDEMKKLGMEAALAVGESSDYKPCMVVMEWDGTGGKQKKPVGLVGKGLTMDTGGYNIKTQKMELMKMDMCGSAAVVGAMRALAEQKAQTNVVAVVGLAENRITGGAMLPSAIIGSMKGLTIEIGNTDAEGRLVLADAMTYLARTYKPHTIVDLATLTGACVMAHGHDKAGFFTNNKGLVKQFNKAAEDSGEGIAHDPIEQKHRDAMKGKISDLSNMGYLGKEGHITAAAFLENFVEGKTKWAHIDIAGTAIPPSGMASGYGVKLLVEWINQNYLQPKSASQKLSNG